MEDRASISRTPASPSRQSSMRVREVPDHLLATAKRSGARVLSGCAGHRGSRRRARAEGRYRSRWQRHLTAVCPQICSPMSGGWNPNIALVDSSRRTSAVVRRISLPSCPATGPAWHERGRRRARLLLACGCAARRRAAGAEAAESIRLACAVSSLRALTTSTTGVARVLARG